MKATEYPPTESNRTIPRVTISLDDSPTTRWNDVVTPLSGEIKGLLDEFLNMIPGFVKVPLLKYIDSHADEMIAAFPRDYGKEIEAIAGVTGIDKGMMIVYNIFYEVFGLCTSVVAQDKQGNVYHARNLDFGLFLGWDLKNRTWAITEKLRPLLFIADFVKDGKVLYSSVSYAGYVGHLTAVKKGYFSVTVDSRFDGNLDKGLFQWIGGDHTGNFLTFTTRTLLESNLTYDEVISELQTIKMVGPSYIIVGGTTGQGAVVTRAMDKALDVWTLESELAKGSFYILETNYDHWKAPPFFDDRVRPAEGCLAEIGAENINFETLFDMLSAEPNLNRLTTYTALMDVANGTIEAYKQYCPGQCTLW